MTQVVYVAIVFSNVFVKGEDPMEFDVGETKVTGTINSFVVFDHNFSFVCRMFVVFGQ